MHIGFWWGSWKERDYQEDVDVGGMKIKVGEILE
jgi:hypothetical protein